MKKGYCFALQKLDAMTEIIIDRINTNFLIKRLRELFNPYIISEGNETVLNFKNSYGEGTFTIITLDNDKLNIHFKGKFSEDTDIKFYNSKQSAINFFYLQNGHLLISHNDEDNPMAENGVQQLIYGSDSNDVETIKWSANVYVEFNFLKLFDFAYADHLNETIDTRLLLNGDNVTKYIKASGSKEIDSKSPLLQSTRVAENRKEDLEKNIRKIFDIQMQEIVKYQ